MENCQGTCVILLYTCSPSHVDFAPGRAHHPSSQNVNSVRLIVSGRARVFAQDQLGLKPYMVPPVIWWDIYRTCREAERKKIRTDLGNALNDGVWATNIAHDLPLIGQTRGCWRYTTARCGLCGCESPRITNNLQQTAS